MLIDEHITHKDFHAQFDENLFHDLVTDDILDPCINQNNPNIKDIGQGTGQQDPQRRVVAKAKAKKWFMPMLQTGKP